MAPGWQTLCCFVSAPALLWWVWVLATTPESEFSAAHSFHLMAAIAPAGYWAILAAVAAALQLSGLWIGPRWPVIAGAWLALCIWSGVAIAFWSNEASTTGRGMYTLCAIWSALGMYRAQAAGRALSWMPKR